MGSSKPLTCEHESLGSRALGCSGGQIWGLRAMGLCGGVVTTMDGRRSCDNDGWATVAMDGRTLIDVQKGKLTMHVNDEEVVDKFTNEVMWKNQPKDPLEKALFAGEDGDDEEKREMLYWLDFLPTIPKETMKFEALEMPSKLAKPSIEEPLFLELKPLPEHLSFARRKIASSVEGALGWTIADIQGISTSICMHKIRLKDDAKPTIEN
ncbi:hypothetical protein CRG98_013234 [Punica granatum]|uniref:Uncharacterized protein n=1 Tax=Punica granatum TaxID=22663 RepID=A0A2I0KD25_PUNGR|nr:hypothetical protein CRG98_013234 [Punica granatum]